MCFVAYAGCLRYGCPVCGTYGINSVHIKTGILGVKGGLETREFTSQMTTPTRSLAYILSLQPSAMTKTSAWATQV